MSSSSAAAAAASSERGGAGEAIAAEELASAGHYVQKIEHMKSVAAQMKRDIAALSEELKEVENTVSGMEKQVDNVGKEANYIRQKMVTEDILGQMIKKFEDYGNKLQLKVYLVEK